MRAWRLRAWRQGIVLLVAAVCIGLVLPATATAATAPQLDATAKQLTDGDAMYPRLIRLQHSGWFHDGRILASVMAADGGPHAGILQSTDDGRSFHEIGRIADPAASTGSCCGTLFELPRRLGELPSGTLLWAGSFGAGLGTDGHGAGARSIRVWASRDHGRSWSYLSDCADNPAGVGLWEPELTMTGNGRLACFFGDESQRGTHSQVIATTLSADGVHWGGRRDVVATPRTGERPGMPVVRRLPGGEYVMSYENCNVPGYFCGGYLRTSPDGVHWGDPAEYGEQVRTGDGHYFQHAPTIALVPGGPNGTRIVAVGQIYVDAGGAPAPGDGRSVLVNDGLGGGSWYRAPAPIAIPDTRDAPCPNYSSALLATHGGRALLEVATDLGDGDRCHAYYATGTL